MAARAHEEDELRLGDVETGVAKRSDVGAVGLGDVLELDHGVLNRSPVIPPLGVATGGSPP